MNVYMLVDRSGSMMPQWDETISSINGYVKALPKDTNVYLAAFDHDYTPLRNTTAKKWKDLDKAEIQPRGNTRLFDSAARIMQRAIDDNAERTIVVVLTDGEENASQNFRQHDVKTLASQLTTKKWELVFLGANFDKVGDVATNFGIQSNKWANMTRGNMMGYMTTTLSDSTASYAATGAAFNFTEADKAKASGSK